MRPILGYSIWLSSFLFAGPAQAQNTASCLGPTPSKGAAASEVLLVQDTLPAAGGSLLPARASRKLSFRPLSGALAGVTQLRAVRYEFKPGKGPEGEQVGVIAQEVEQLYPELVRTDQATGLKSVNYAQLTPVLLEALKELELKVSEQADQLARQQQQQARTTARFDDLSAQLRKLQESLGVVVPGVVLK